MLHIEPQDAGTDPPCKSLKIPRQVLPALALSVIGVGILVFVGWLIHSPALQAVVPGMISMKVNTALNLILLAMAILLFRYTLLWQRAVAWTCVGLVLAISVLTAWEYVFQLNFGIDAIFASDAISQYPGRMAPATLFCFFCLCAAFSLIALNRAVSVAQAILLITATAPLITLGGYLYRAPAMYQHAPYPVIALNTSVCLMMLCLCGLASSQGRGLMWLICSVSLAGKLFRRLLPLAVGLPVAIGFLVLWGEREGLYTTAFGSALVVGSCALFFSMAVWWSATILWTAEEQILLSNLTAKKAKQMAETANLSKDVFIAAVSHELRTPLNPVLVNVTMLETRKDLPVDVLQDLAVIRRNIQLEAHIVDDLLTLTRLQRNKIDIRQEVIDLQLLIGEVVSEMQPHFTQKNVVVETHFQGRLQEVWADPIRMRQVFSNIIGNAVKFSTDDGRVWVSAIADAGQVHINVKDNGVGIAQALLPKLFRPFEQGEKTITRQFGGLGLGLVISQGIVEMHGGNITVASEGAGKGATFMFDLTLASPVHEHRADIEKATPATLTISDAARRLLLVEDHADTLRIMSRLLKGFGYEVATASNLTDAIAIIESRQFDVLISDIGLPDGSGLDLLRAAQTYPPAAAIALSGYGQASDIQRSKDAGFCEHLVKPVNIEQLKIVLAKCVTAIV